MRSPRQQKWNSLLMVHGAIYRQQIHCLCQLTGNWSVSIEPIHLSAGHNSFSTNGPIHWNDCRDNHGLWLSFSRLLLSEHQPWGQKHNRLNSPFFMCSPPQGQEQVHNCFEWPNRFSTIVSAQQNILETRGQSLHSRTQGCASGIDARVSVPSPRSMVFRDVALSWQPIWGKWNANMAAKFFFFFFFPAAAAEQSTLRIFLRLDSPLRPRWIMKVSSKQSGLRYREVWDENRAASLCSSSSHRAGNW